MGFKDKLSRLGSPLPAEARDRADGASRADVLDELRQKMQRIMGAPALVPRPPADPSRTSLPFAREELPSGVLHRRQVSLPRSHAVGRIPVDAAAAAQPELLALLALDTALGACRTERALFLDTETTGLGAGGGVWAFLVGMASFDADGRLQVEQLLLQSPAHERALVERVSERIAAADFLVTYNGKTFDLPLLAARAVMCRLPPLAAKPHLDLLHVARRLHKGRLGACRLVTLESEVLGFVRGPDIEGGEIPARYAHFLRTGDEEALACVVEHNAWDVASMAALVGLYGEPYDLLHPTDLLGMARTFKRAGALSAAERVADTALERGAGHEGLRVRGSIAKARGDRARALADFESFAAEASDAAVRLELVKLYEHFLKVPARALELLELGTGESEEAVARRRTRLTRKATRSGS